jgi:hypothetical protein
MIALQVAISSDDLRRRMQYRLAGRDSASPVVWQQRGQRVLLHLENLAVHALDGWLLVSLDLETDATGRQSVQFVFFLGTVGEGDGLNASGTLNVATVPASQLAELWGADAQRLIWDAVLDGLEAALAQARLQRPADPIVLEGFTCGPDELRVRLLAGVP